MDDSLSTTLPEITVMRDSPTFPEHEQSPLKADTDTAHAVEAAYPAAFSSAAVPASESWLDRYADKLNPSIGHADDAYKMLNDYYVEHSEAINSAGHALAVDGLDLLGRLHPFLEVAILPFKLMTTMYITQQQNNKKVLAVAIQIQDTMSVLFRLRHTQDVKIKAPDGHWVKGLSDLITDIAADIKICGTACDHYLNKGVLAKVLKCKIYEGRFEDFMEKFNEHRKNVLLFLQTHIAVAVDNANEKLDEQAGELRLIKGMLGKLFQKLDTPREHDVQEFIAAKGGAKACLENDAYLKELIEKSGENFPGRSDLAGAKKMLEAELKEDFDKALAKHTDVFLCKLDAQEKQLTEAIVLLHKLDARDKQLTKAIDQTGEHVISTVIDFLSGGIHTNIEDQDLKQLWEKEDWKGSVNARYFVLALNEYYTEKFDPTANNVVGSPTKSRTGSPSAAMVISAAPLGCPALNSTTTEALEDERWALAYINVAHLQPILDVIDTDGSGFISIKEANHFARLRPPTWR
ncbi:hypothetical protein R3P38DRAFT_3483583 [Favolaschia claudopus]|uniref:EF-hand domain-containing protein n=1 Tax=Favolaschia claudopus TaxID=2862362 RepID=A0AAW0C9I2_9AGAR